MCVVKKKRKKVEAATSGQQQIIARMFSCWHVTLIRLVSSLAHALPMFRDERVRSLKRTREKARNDPVASHKPEAPIVGKGEKNWCSDFSLYFCCSRCWWSHCW